MFYTSQYSPGGRERGQNCAWSPPSDPLVTYSSLQVTDTGKRQCYRLTDLMQVVGGGAKIVLWILAELLYKFIGRGFTAKTLVDLACIRTRDQQSPSHLGLLLPGFKPRGTGYESIYDAIISTRLTYFYKTQKFHMRFFWEFVESRNFFFCLVFATIHLMSDPRDKVEGNIRTRKTKVTGFWRDLTLNVLLYNFWTFTSTATKK